MYLPTTLPGPRQRSFCLDSGISWAVGKMVDQSVQCVFEQNETGSTVQYPELNKQRDHASLEDFLYTFTFLYQKKALHF